MMRSPAMASVPLLVGTGSLGVLAPPLDVVTELLLFAIVYGAESRSGLDADAGVDLDTEASVPAGVVGVEALEGEELTREKGPQVLAEPEATHDCKHVSSPVPRCARGSGIVAREAWCSPGSAERRTSPPSASGLGVPVRSR